MLGIGLSWTLARVRRDGSVTFRDIKFVGMKSESNGPRAE